MGTNSELALFPSVTAAGCHTLLGSQDLPRVLGWKQHLPLMPVPGLSRVSKRDKSPRGSSRLAGRYCAFHTLSTSTQECLGLRADRSVTVQPGQAGAGNALGAAHQPTDLLPLQAWHVRPGKSTEPRAKVRCWTVTPLHKSSCGSWASTPAQPDLALQGVEGAASSHHTFQLLAVRR